MSANINATEEIDTTVDAKKRAFMAKFGQYAVAGAGMSVLMAPSLSATTGSGVVTATTIKVDFDGSTGVWNTGNNNGAWESTDTNPSSPENFVQWYQNGNVKQAFTYDGYFGGGSTTGNIFYEGTKVGTWASDYVATNGSGSVYITWDSTIYFD